MGVVPIILAAMLIDVAFPNKDYLLVIQTAVLIFAVMLLGQLIGFIAGTDRSDQQPLPANIMSAYTMSRIALDLKIQFYKHMQKLSMNFFAQRPVGEHMFRCTTDVDDAAYLASEVIPKIFAAAQRITIIVLVLIMKFDAWLLIPSCVYLVIYFSVKHWITTRVRAWDRHYRVEYQRTESVLREILFPCKVIKSYTLERTAKRWYVSQAGRLVAADFSRTLYTWCDMMISTMMLPIYLGILSFYVGSLVLNKHLTVGEYTILFGLMTQFVTPFQEAVITFQLIRQKLVPGERMVETLAIAPLINDAPGAQPLNNAKGKIELRNVSFAYANDIPVLKNVSLVVHPGEKVALVGPNGAGKSTLCALLVRLYDPAEGELRIDDISYRDVTQESLRRNMAIVTDTTNTFTESIEQNIRYGKPTASQDAVLRAAVVAHVDEFVSQMRNGYATVLTEGGSISGGQKQRLCVARALVREAPILILDEATSALDPLTETQVITKIDQAYGDRTRIVVAHNLRTARTADRIYVLEAGRVVESGTHDELMQAGKVYRNLWGHD
jgi:ABC-type multidrug transport system fused ATPase/permease subunit